MVSLPDTRSLQEFLEGLRSGVQHSVPLNSQIVEAAGNIDEVPVRSFTGESGDACIESVDSLVDRFSLLPGQVLVQETVEVGFVAVESRVEVVIPAAKCPDALRYRWDVVSKGFRDTYRQADSASVKGEKAWTRRASICGARRN